jgi:murein DD-endopeptidase MepM/ murein hydrolase activator NlpD
MHKGLDFAAMIGTPIYAPADGVVSYAGREGGYGKIVSIDHGYGIVTRYAHNSRLLVKTGERVKRWQKIAEVGSTGRSSGPHLHYEVRVNGVPVDPENYILSN